MRQNDGDGDSEREKGSRPRRVGQLPPKTPKSLEGVDDSQESPVDDSDRDSDYKFVEGESSVDDNSETSDIDNPGPAVKKTKATKAKTK